MAKCTQIAHLPVIGNGDLYSWREAEDRMANTGVTGLMLARCVPAFAFACCRIRSDDSIFL